MRRALHIAISVLAVILLVRPLDCFANSTLSHAAADCCKKGNCAPSANADDCCKVTVPGGNELVPSKAANVPTPDFMLPEVFGSMPEVFAAHVSVNVLAPRGSPPILDLSLPLLI
jgi:hypothetical protein